MQRCRAVPWTLAPKLLLRGQRAHLGEACGGRLEAEERLDRRVLRRFASMQCMLKSARRVLT